jgi:hypothetical protein
MIAFCDVLSLSLCPQSSFLRVYASYNANYAKALLTIKQCKQQKKFNEFLEVRRHLCASLLPLIASAAPS